MMNIFTACSSWSQSQGCFQPPKDVFFSAPFFDAMDAKVAAYQRVASGALFDAGPSCQGVPARRPMLKNER